MTTEKLATQSKDQEEGGELKEATAVISAGGKTVNEFEGCPVFIVQWRSRVVPSVF